MPRKRKTCKVLHVSSAMLSIHMHIFVLLFAADHKQGTLHSTKTLYYIFLHLMQTKMGTLMPTLAQLMYRNLELR